MQKKSIKVFNDKGLEQIGVHLWAKRGEEKNSFFVKPKCPSCETFGNVQEIFIEPDCPTFETHCGMCKSRTGWSLKNSSVLTLKVI